MAELAQKFARRGAIRVGVAFASAAASAAAFGQIATNNQGGPSLSKAAVGYQDIPCNGRVCAQCVFFVFKPAVNTSPASRCGMVAGLINPAGWCDIWAPKT